MAGTGTLESLSIIVRATEGLGLLALAGFFLAISFFARQNVPRTMQKFSRVSRIPSRIR